VPAPRAAAVLLALAASLLACQAPNALRRSERIVRQGFDTEERGGWVVFTAPGSLLLAGANLAVGSFVPLGPPPEPEQKWFRTYSGPMLPTAQVAVLCARDRATSVERLRRPDGPWVAGRHAAWHFPLCIEVLPGRYELEVGYFRRDTDEGGERLVTLQAESTEPSLVLWDAQAGGLYELFAVLGSRAPAAGGAPRRSIPRSRSLGTSWWELETSAWSARIEALPSWDAAPPAVLEARREWEQYERDRE
jgi:hypothetical protein